MTIHRYLRERLSQGRKLLVPYLCAGFPSEAETLPLLEALADAGADAIELGIPFSDSLLDGPVIQAASTRALRGGMTLQKALNLARTFTARRETPLLLMSSVNPLLRMSPETFARRAREAEVAACIVPDLPPEARFLLPGAPPLVQLVAPNTPEDRLADLLRTDPPFLYAVSVFGVTGARTSLATYTLPFLKRVKKATQTPILAGFGVSSPEQAEELAAVCDGVIIGSALLQALQACEEPCQRPQAARDFLAPYRKTLDAMALGVG